MGVLWVCTSIYISPDVEREREREKDGIYLYFSLSLSLADDRRLVCYSLYSGHSVQRIVNFSVLSVERWQTRKEENHLHSDAYVCGENKKKKKRRGRESSSLD